MYNLTGRELIRLIILEYITLMRDFVFPGVISEKISEITGLLTNLNEIFEITGNLAIQMNSR